MPDNGICTSIACDSLSSIQSAIDLHERQSEFVEIRLDALSDIPDIGEISSLKSTSKLILTLRPSSQGGLRGLDEGERLAFWNSIAVNLAALDETLLFDIEHDIITAVPLPRERVIASIHDFSGDIDDKDLIIERLALHADLVKIAWMTFDARESIGIFKLQDQARARGIDLIPIAMGEAGKLTRILAVSKGAPFSYCASGEGATTAPGQISATEMQELYRMDSIRETTKVFGLIAGDTNYSLSPKIHNTIFNETECDCVFVPMQTRAIHSLIENILSDEFPFEVGGFAVTNPFKIDAMNLADELDETARRTGAVNTLKILDRRLQGFNTDVRGFINPLKRRFADLKSSRVAVIGTGGAARAAIAALTDEHCEVTVFGRDSSKLSSLRDEFHITTEVLSDNRFNDFRVVVNATPLGTLGRFQDESVASSTALEGAELAYDLVYNPSDTKFLKEARKAGCQLLGGFEMLVEQAAEQQRIWTGNSIDIGRVLSLLEA